MLKVNKQTYYIIAELAEKTLLIQDDFKVSDFVSFCKNGNYFPKKLTLGFRSNTVDFNCEDYDGLLIKYGVICGLYSIDETKPWKKRPEINIVYICLIKDGIVKSSKYQVPEMILLEEKNYSVEEEKSFKEEILWREPLSNP